MASKQYKSIDSCLPDGLVVDRKWLKQNGFNRPRIDAFLRAGDLQAVARGAYRRPGPPLKWEHIVYSLQQLGFPVHVGGRSALEMQGLVHYLPLGRRSVAVYGVSHWPAWAEQLVVEYRLESHNPRMFVSLPDAVLTERPFGHWDWPLRYAAPELAFLELFAELESPEDFELADKLFESAATLRPLVVRTLLLACTHIKAKRLFLWFSNRHKHPWFSVLNTDGINLGKGKRMLVKGGALDTQYLITVPRNMANGTLKDVRPDFL